jgi:hypothetical protein
MLFGMRIEPRIRLREGDTEGKNSLTITVDDRQAAQKLNSIDYQFYQLFRDRYQSLRKDFYYLSDYDRFFKRIGGIP